MALRKIAVNAGKILFGNGFNAVAGLFTTALAARALGPADFGIFVFILTYELIIGQLLSFNSWQALITYGTAACRDGDEATLGQLVKTTLILDGVSSFTGFLLGFSLCSTVIGWLGWPTWIVESLRLYCLVLLFRSGSSLSGVLRLSDQFGQLASISVINSLIRLFAVFVASSARLDIHGFVLAYLAATIAGQLWGLIIAARTIGWQRLCFFLRQPLTGVSARFPGFWSFIWTTNLHASVKLMTREADQIIIAAIASPASLALLKIARQFARILPLVTDSLYQSLFPELGRLKAAGNKSEFSRLIKQSALFGLLVGLSGWLIFLVSGEQIIGVVFGAEFVAAYSTTLIFMLALLVSLVSLPLQPAMLAVGMPEVSFKINLISTIIYLAVLLPMTQSFGIQGAAAAYVLYYLVWAVLMHARLQALIK